MPTLLLLRCLRSYHLFEHSSAPFNRLRRLLSLPRISKRWETRTVHLSAASQQLNPPKAPSYALREYQQEAVDAVQQAFSQGISRQLVCLPTGSGKTVIFCHLARALNKRTLILAHRVELLEQTADKMRVVWPEAQVAMLNRRNRQFDAQVVIASVQTATRPRNLERLMQQGFDVIIVDEAHHAPACSYTGIFTSLEFLEGSEGDSSASDSHDEVVVGAAAPPSRPSGEHPEGGAWEGPGGAVPGSRAELAPAGSGEVRGAVAAAAGRGAGELGSDVDGGDGEVLEVEDLLQLEAPSLLGLSRGGRLLVGFTATPYRLDRKKALGDVFQDIVYQQDITYMIRQGYLVPPVPYRILTDQDLSQLTSSKGDFKTKQLEQLVNTPERNALTVRSYASLAGGRKAVVFCVGVDHAQGMAEEFRAQGVSCAAVHGRLSLVERESLLRRFREGSFQVLTNCMILSEGYDESSVSCVVMARPTQSPGLYTQCIGRGLRLHAQKTDCVVIDMTDRHHDITRVASLDMVYPQAGGGRGGEREAPPPELCEAKVQLDSALPRGRISFITQKYTWAAFPGTPHFVISLFTPAATPGGGRPKWPFRSQPSAPSHPDHSQPPPRRPPQWHVWLIACERLPAAPAPPPPKRGRRKKEGVAGSTAAATAGEEGVGGEVPKRRRGRRRKAGGASSGDVAEAPRRFLAYVMCEPTEGGRGATWQLAGPDASKRAFQRPQKALPLDAAMTWAEQLIEEGFIGHAERNQEKARWRQKPASPKQLLLLKGMLRQAQQEVGQPGQAFRAHQEFTEAAEGRGVEVLNAEQAVEEIVQGLSCGEASDMIGLLKIQEGYRKGRWCFPPTMYAG